MVSLKRFAIVLAALMLISVAASAQTTSALTGTVTLGGNPLPGATVTISSPALQGVRTTTSDVNGNYNFGALPPGTYTVKFEMESMSTITKSVQVTLSGTARADAQMKLTTLAESITVTASAPAVLQTTDVQMNIQQSVVNQLPIARTLQGATALAPGVTTASGSGGAGAGSIQIAGAPAYDSLFMVNGAAVNENLRGQAHNLFIEDAIQETTVLTGAISAEYGRFTGGVVNAITKSGGNEFSGSLRDSMTNDKWTAKGNVYDPTLQKVKKNPNPIVSRINNVYEGTLGGFILRDRLWFFTAGRYAKRDQNNTLTDRDSTGYVFTDTNKRLEGKLTGQITPKNSLVLSYLDVKNPQKNNCFGRCMEWSNIDLGRELPNNFFTAHYNGILSNKLLIEGSYSKKYFAFKGSGGDFADPANGSYGGAYGFGEGYFGAPIFCGFCDPEERNNKLYGAKATYYLASKSFGTHNVAVGYDQWAEQRKANNYQSGSNFAIYSYNDQIRPNCYASTPGDPTSVNCHPSIVNGDAIKWAPIFELTRGSDFKTDSVYVNDKWDLNSHWSFNLGVRYDKNNGTDSSGEKVAKDSAFSPRLGLIYDVAGNGRARIDASYSKYVSRVAETIGSAGAGGGNPSYLYYYYEGPDVNTDHKLNTAQAFAQVFNWFFANGGLHRPVAFGSVAGLATKIQGSLKSPSTDEFTVGFGSQLTQNSFVRIDAVHKKWKDFYSQVTTLGTGTVHAIVNDPATGSVDLGLLDRSIITNTNDLSRKYDALDLQLSYHPLTRLTLGTNYTYSKLKGNVTSETSGSGPVPEAIFSYPEYKAFAQANPTGYLPGDQRHKLRAWASYDMPTHFGNFNASLLQRYDSGTPYSASGLISTSKITNPGYQTPPTRVTYFFSGRGAYRWDNISSTDLGLTYELPISRFAVFAQAKMVNIFNQQGVINGDTTILTSRNSSCKQTTGANVGKRCAAFNPLTDTPVEGINWVKGPNFGKGLNPTTSAGANLLAPNGSYQLPRTYYFSLGARF